MEGTAHGKTPYVEPKTLNCKHPAKSQALRIWHPPSVPLAITTAACKTYNNMTHRRCTTNGCTNTCTHRNGIVTSEEDDVNVMMPLPISVTNIVIVPASS